MENDNRFSDEPVVGEGGWSYSSKNNNLKRLRDRVKALKKNFNAINQMDFTNSNDDDDDFVDNPSIMRTNEYDYMKPSEAAILRDEVEFLRYDINTIKSGRDNKDEDIEFVEEHVLTVPEDSYSFIMLMPLSIPALVAWSVFAVQITTYFLAIEDSLGFSVEGDDLKPTPPLGIPRGNDVVVKIGQGLAILIICIVQESCWDAFSLLYYGYNVSLRLKGGFRYRWWLLANIGRLIEGFTGTFVVFVLTVRSSNVVDLLKDFTALTFMSTLHGIAFKIAGLGFIGKKLKAAAEKCMNFAVEDIVPPKGVYMKTKCLPFLSCKPYICGHKINRHLVSMTVLMMTMYLSWTFICLIPQRNMKFLCQSVYVQLDDNINNKLGFFSGYYDLQPASSISFRSFVQQEVTYKERRGVEIDSQPMVLRFCPSSSTWVFALENKDDSDKECNDDNIVAQSNFAEDDQHYNIMEIDNSDWSALNEDGRMLPMSDFILNCADELNKDDYDTEFSMCDHIQVDNSKGFEDFSGTKEWSKDYFTFNSTYSDGKAKLYKRPIFLSKPIDSQFDVIIFTGARWAITSSLLIQKFDYIVNDTYVHEKREKLLKYLEKDFHGYWSDYTADFFSQAINEEKPIDRMSPVRLNWFFSTESIHSLPNAKEVRESQFPDFEQTQKSTFLCALCDNQTNPCQFSNTCNLNKTCECTTGSTGTLCHEAPTGNGLCDDYFNFMKYNYDGGDCCIHSCVSGKYDCGLDRRGLYYVGYDKCKVISKEDTYTRSAPLVLSGFQINEVHISPNGKFLVVTVVQSRVAQFYDSDGSKWNMRGATLNFDSKSDHILEISNPTYAIMTDRIPPATVTISRGSDICVYDWDVSSFLWIETKLQSSNQKSQKIKDVKLIKEGLILCVLKEDGNLEIYERSLYLSTWILSPRTIPPDTVFNGKYNSFSISENGDVILLASKNCILVHNTLEDSNKYEEICHNETIKSVKISPSGQTAAVISAIRGHHGQIHVYNILKHTLRMIESKIRGVESEGIVQNVVEEGGGVITILTHATSKIKSRVYFYQYLPEENEWNVFKDFEDVERLVESSDGKVIASYRRWQDSIEGYTGGGGVINFLHKDENESNKMDNYYFTLQVDNHPRELEWEIIKISDIGRYSSQNQTQKFDMQVMMKGGSYNSSMIITRSVTIPNSDCLVLKITDFGFEGLADPGYAGFVRNQIIIWETSNMDGYENYFAFNPNSDLNKKCQKAIEKKVPWAKYDVSKHGKCQEIQCKWNQVGSEIPYIEEHQEFTPVISLSACGSVMAVSSGTLSSLLKKKGAVGIYMYDGQNKNWTLMGKHILLGKENENYWVTNSIELSADGTMIVIGSIWQDNKNIPGMVRVLKYDEPDNNWEKNVTIRNDATWFGFSTSMSSDGNIIAVASGGNSSCIAHVYHFDQIKNDWLERGNCADNSQMKSAYSVKLSSNGKILAIGIPFFEVENKGILGSVKVFEFDSLRGVWEKIGDSFLGDKSGDYIGFSLSLSADGHVLAFTGNLNSPTKIFVYNTKTKSWSQRGVNISLPYRGGISGHNVVHLSSSGSIVIISEVDKNNIFIWDDMSQEWIAAVHQFPDLKWITSAFSADAVTTAVMQQNEMNQYGRIDVFRLEYTYATECDHSKEVLFNLTIFPDKFQEDIKWSLTSKFGKIVIGGELSNSALDKPPPLVFTQCVSNNPNLYFKFDITDKYGDGICCDWGKGRFEVHWDSVLVMNETSFTSKISKYFPPSLPVANVGVNIRTENGENDEIHYTVRNVNHHVYVEETVKGNVDYKKDWELVANECYTVLIYNNTVNNGNTNLEISWDGKVYASRKKENVFEKIKIGNCNQTICEDGFTNFEIDIMTHSQPRDFAWLLKTGDRLLFGYDMYSLGNHHHFHRSCVPEKECLFLHLLNQASNGESIYYAADIVYRNSHNVSLNEKFQDTFIEHRLRDCSLTQCQEGYTLLQFEFQTNLHPDRFTWSLKNSTDDLLIGQAGYEEKFKFYQYNRCIPTNDCAKFTVASYGEGYLAFYALRWANEKVIEKGKPGYQIATYAIFC